MSVREAFYFVTCEAYGNAFPLQNDSNSHEGGLNMEVLIRWEYHCGRHRVGRVQTVAAKEFLSAGCPYKTCR